MAPFPFVFAFWFGIPFTYPHEWQLRHLLSPFSCHRPRKFTYLQGSQERPRPKQFCPAPGTESLFPPPTQFNLVRMGVQVCGRVFPPTQLNLVFRRFGEGKSSRPRTPSGLLSSSLPEISDLGIESLAPSPGVLGTPEGETRWDLPIFLKLPPNAHR